MTILDHTDTKVNVVVSVIVEQDGKYLLVEDRKHPGSWNVPGGKVELDESIFDAARREFLEETGFEVDLSALAQVSYELWKFSCDVMVRFAFWGELVDSSTQREHESLAVVWKSAEEIRSIVDVGKMRNGYAARLASLALAGKRYPLESVLTDVGSPDDPRRLAQGFQG